ncbi:MAG: RNA-binding protein [Rhodobacteraceae bacterium]|nr:RNA-binding protein [Paracoccaceae bacterium]
MARGGGTKLRDAPQRRCIATGTSGGARGLIRFAVGPDNKIVPDVLGKLPGRGIWVSADRDALETAVQKKLFARAAKQPVEVPQTLVADVETALTRRLIDVLSLARKAGRAVAGYEKVKDWLTRDQAVLLMQASDGSERGKSKLRAPGGRGTLFEVLTGSELGLAFGREHVIHAALAKGGLTDAVRDDALRLSGVRKIDGRVPAGKVKKTI